MKKKLLTMTLALTMAAGLTACGTDVSSVGTTAEAAETAETVEHAEWGLDDIAELGDIVTGITDREYAANAGANYVIYEDISYDPDIVYTVLFNTASVRFDTPGEYDMTYWVYFDTAALTEWADENDVSLDIPDADRLAVTVYATVTITEAEEEDAEEDAEDDADAEDTDSAADDGTTAASTTDSAKSTSGGSSGTSSSSTGSTKGASSCNHTWVKDGGYYESVLVSAAYDERVLVAEYAVCTNCGYKSTNVDDVAGHCIHVCGCGYTFKDEYATTHHDAVYSTQWVQSYKCSKCGATK